MRTLSVTIPEYERRFLVAKKSRKSGKPRWWTVNGQGLYNATLHYTVRSRVTAYYHTYLSRYIKNQISEQDIELIRSLVYIGSEYKLSTSVDIYEIRRGKLPDCSNLWLWMKWFEDALQESGVIPDDDPDYIIESGRKRYHFVDSEDKRKLVFHIKFLKQ